METDKPFLHRHISLLVAEKPMIADFFGAFGINPEQQDRGFRELVDGLLPLFWETHHISKEELTDSFIHFMEAIDNASQLVAIQRLDVLAGVDKSGKPEGCGLTIFPGEVICIVGPTGSGKSRLLADIEWLANADTPTRRVVQINQSLPSEELLNRFGGKLIAQITQNMNFVLDMDVQNFLLMHAQSRFVDNADAMVQEVIGLANELSGEQFDAQTPVTFLSGGQSRALMIADVACIGQAPIVLIDEIENAGVDKKKALELLVQRDKIVLMATHDPLLILNAHKRVVIQNGGMQKCITTNDDEKRLHDELEQMDHTIQRMRQFFRSGNEYTAAYGFGEGD
ncbi:MAG: ATP-binding cassette domain-containing protein [Breznakibacter sp.]